MTTHTDHATKSTPLDVVDDAVADLRANATAWARRSIVAKIADLEQVVDATERAAPRWVALAVNAKRIPDGSPLAGEEWISGPWALISGAAAFADTLRAIDEGKDPLAGAGLRVRADGQLVIDVFPATIFDRLLLNAYHAEVWMQPGVTPGALADHVAPHYRDPSPEGRVDLVLGAGNIASIPPLDLLSKLFVDGAVAIVKLNPVNDYLGPVFEEIFAPLVAAGFVRFVYGAADVGSHLCRHAGIDSVHITGSARTHGAIVYGPGPDGADRKAANDPVLTKPITSELGGVGPVIVVPGPWDDAELRHHAENIATMKLHNGGCNCIAAQIVVLPDDWPLADRLVDEVAAVIRDAPPRHPYYPGAAERRTALVQDRDALELLDDTDTPRTLIRELDPADTDEICFRTEAFGGVLATTKIRADGVGGFLRAAVRFCNDTLDGTLGATVLIHPTTARDHAVELDRAVAELRYGTIGVNCWNGVGFLLQRTPWGAFPGHTLDDIQSGIGVVHNSLMLTDTQKTVVSGPFRTFPQSTLHRDVHLATKPPWFVTHRNAAVLGERLTRFAGHPTWWALPKLFPPALTG